MEDADPKVLALFKASDALLQGHFKLTSGKHSEWYFEKIRLIVNPAALEKLVDLLAAKIRADGRDFDYVVSPAYGAIAIGFLAALKLGKKFAFTQRVDEKMSFRAGFSGIDGARAVRIRNSFSAAAARAFDFVSISHPTSADKNKSRPGPLRQWTSSFLSDGCRAPQINA